MTRAFPELASTITWVFSTRRLHWGGQALGPQRRQRHTTAVPRRPPAQRPSTHFRHCARRSPFAAAAAAAAIPPPPLPQCGCRCR
eukprot:gene24018-biopygen1316